MSNSLSIDDILQNRSTKYGIFAGHAKISQSLKDCVRSQPNYEKLAPDQKEAIEMTMHKIARILNGDPNFHDSWYDIMGYNKLVADRLIGISNE